MKRPWFSNL